MKQTIFILLALALCWGCITDREPTARSKVAVELTVRSDPMTTTTRATDDTTIRDLNFYLMDKAGRVVVSAISPRRRCTSNVLRAST